MMQNTLEKNRVGREVAAAYKTASLPVETRVADLLNRMTLEEKVAQMVCIWGQKKTLLFDSSGNLDFGELRRQYGHGVGQIARVSDTGGGLCAREMAALANKLQRFFVEETRLGIPAIFHEECLHGLAAKEATSYPQPIGLASTFNPRLVEEIYSAIAEDARSRGVHQALTPVVDVAREPRWGRVEETFGEDPYLVAQMGIAAVRGFQGTGNFRDKKRVLATLKHFAAHGQPESGMNCGPVNISERTLRDTFLMPFREVITKANVRSVMASYNEIDGVPSHANTWLLRDVLRKEWGFKGFVVSDYYAITELHRRDEATSHSVARDKADAALLAAVAGVNIELPDPDCYPYLAELVRDGRMDMALLDELLAPMLRAKFELGLFEDPYVDETQIHAEQRLEQERALALRSAHEVITLLKNDRNLLPLNRDNLRTLAVIGPNADRKLLGGYTGEPKFWTSILDGIRQKVGKKIRIEYSEGCRLTVGGSWNDDAVTFADAAENQGLIRHAVDTARQSDLVVLALGGNEQTSREAWNRTHMGDRANLELVGMQNDLLKAVLATGKPVVVVLINGRPNSIGFVQEHVSAILECWYLGQETGNAIADVLFGDFNPCGKLPISIPRSAGHLPCYYNYKPSARRGYLGDDVSSLYPFGFGLSYTAFRLNNVRLERASIRTNESTSVSVDVKNVGSRGGEEVVQMYIRDLVSSVTRPTKELKGFAKVALQPGETQTVVIPIHPEALAFTDIRKNFVVEPGEFEIMVGTSSRDADLQKVVLNVTR